MRIAYKYPGDARAHAFSASGDQRRAAFRRGAAGISVQEGSGDLRIRGPFGALPGFLLPIVQAHTAVRPQVRAVEQGRLPGEQEGEQPGQLLRLRQASSGILQLRFVVQVGAAVPVGQIAFHHAPLHIVAGDALGGKIQGGLPAEHLNRGAAQGVEKGAAGGLFRVQVPQEYQASPAQGIPGRPGGLQCGQGPFPESPVPELVVRQGDVGPQGRRGGVQDTGLGPQPAQQLFQPFLIQRVDPHLPAVFRHRLFGKAVEHNGKAPVRKAAGPPAGHRSPVVCQKNRFPGPGWRIRFAGPTRDRYKSMLHKKTPPKLQPCNSRPFSPLNIRRRAANCKPQLKSFARAFPQPGRLAENTVCRKSGVTRDRSAVFL